MDYSVGDLVISKCNHINSDNTFACPVIIMAKDNDKYYGLKLGTYDKKENFDKYLKVIILGSKYNLKKLSTIDFRGVVYFNKDDISRLIYHLPDDKMNSILKMLYFIIKSKIHRDSISLPVFEEFKKIIDFDSYIPYYNKGDLIRYKDYYLLVVKRVDNKLMCYRVHDKNKSKYYFDTHGSRGYYIKYNNLVSIDAKDLKKHALRSIMSKYFMNYVLATRYAYCNNNANCEIKSTFYNNSFDDIYISTNDIYTNSDYYLLNKESFKFKNDHLMIKKKGKRR